MKNKIKKQIILPSENITINFYHDKVQLIGKRNQITITKNNLPAFVWIENQKIYKEPRSVVPYKITNNDIIRKLF